MPFISHSDQLFCGNVPLCMGADPSTIWKQRLPRGTVNLVTYLPENYGGFINESISQPFVVHGHGSGILLVLLLFLRRNTNSQATQFYDLVLFLCYRYVNVHFCLIYLLFNFHRTSYTDKMESLLIFLLMF